MILKLRCLFPGQTLNLNISPCSHILTHTLACRILVVLNESSQAKVCDFTNQVISHQDVGSPQVSVDVVHPLDEGHAICDLRQEHSGGGGVTYQKMVFE